ncbi:hypothetical protein [Ponticaulis profundi]|uniref:Lipoprotein n=1 Tax=Ponticaulis profundi TaxID=2665222 RepID=A0ABW1S891_9PROT
MKFTLILFFMSLFAPMCSQANEEDKKLSFDISAGLEEKYIRVCLSITNKSKYPALVPAPFSFKLGNQVALEFVDTSGNPLIYFDGIIGGSSRPKPFRSDRLNYLQLWPDDSFSTCSSYYLQNLPEIFEFYGVYEPWLEIDDPVPFTADELRLYKEVYRKHNKLKTDTCIVDKARKTIKCQPM